MRYTSGMEFMPGRDDRGSDWLSPNNRRGVEAARFDEVAESGLESLIEILENRPELRQYIIQSNVANARNVIMNLRQILDTIPGVMYDLSRTSAARKPGEIVMAVLPQYPLVLTRQGEETIAFAPALTCTLNAVAAVQEKMAGYHNFFVGTTKNGLIPTVLEMLENSSDPVLSFDPQTMDPLDYIALGATGIFKNEPFRVKIER